MGGPDVTTVGDRPPRIQIYSATIGEGHDGPARRLAATIREREPAAAVEIVDFLALVPAVRTIAVGGSSFHSRLGSRLFDLIFWLASDVPPTRWLNATGLVVLTARAVRREIARFGPDAIVSTYPGSTITLGKLRALGRVRVPVVAAITDLAALRVWAHPAVDEHLITHPESAAEVRALAPASRIDAVSGLTSAGFEALLDPIAARRSLDLPQEGPCIVVSGGGWAVGDLEGAALEALRIPGATVVCLCGRNEDVRARVERRLAGEARAVVLGFTDRIAELFAAADVVVHSTAGLTVLEAMVAGCRVISFGWGHGHIRVNNRAFTRFGLAEVARDRAELRAALARALESPAVAARELAELPDAADVVLGLVA